MAKRSGHPLIRLELQGIWAAPPGAPRHAVRGASLEVLAGEWVALGGPNGCGKTTLLHVAAGLLEPRRGTRSLDLLPGHPRGPGSAPRVATILQDPSVQLFAPTVAEEIELTALHLGLPAEQRQAQVRRWSSRFGLDDDLGRAPASLSAGRQQLVLLAAALAAEPDLLVADEPGAHLDADSRRRVLEAIAAETRRGLAVLWATQDDEEWGAASRSVTLVYPQGDEQGGAEPAAAPLARGEATPEAAAVLTLGGATPEAGTEVREAAASGPGAGGPLAGVLMTLRIERPLDLEGPRVRTSEPFELELPATGLVSLEGPNGAGKSVLLAVACGLLSLDQVRITPGIPLGAPPLLVGEYPERQIFEDTVGRELAFAAVSRGMPRSEALGLAADALASLEMAARLAPARHTWELSMGEKRLVLLVGGLIAPCGLLALDEPTAGLDAARRGGLARLVTEKSRQGLVLIASQDAAWLRTLPARRLVVSTARQSPSSTSKKTD